MRAKSLRSVTPAIFLVALLGATPAPLAARPHAGAERVKQDNPDARTASTGCLPYIRIGSGLKYKKYLALIPVNVRLSCAETRPAITTYLKTVRDYRAAGRCDGSRCSNAPSPSRWSCSLARPSGRYPYAKCRKRGQEAWAIAPSPSASVATVVCLRLKTRWGSAEITVRDRWTTCSKAVPVARGYFARADKGARFDFYSSTAGGGWKIKGWRCRPAAKGTIGDCQRGRQSFYTQRTPPACTRKVPKTVACIRASGRA